MSSRKLLISLFIFLTLIFIKVQSFDFLSFLIPSKSSEVAPGAEPIAIAKTVRFVLIPIIGDINETSYPKSNQLFLASQTAGYDGILLLIDSSGGDAGPTKIITEAVSRAAKCKPLISFVAGNAWSSAYWIAASTPYILAAPTASTGNIGVRVTAPAYGKDQERPFLFSCEEFKFTRYDQNGNLLPEHEKLLIEFAESSSLLLRNEIVSMRPVLTHEAIINMQGKFFVGAANIELKLIDKLGSLKDAVAELYRRAGSPACDHIELLTEATGTLASYLPEEMLS